MQESNFKNYLSLHLIVFVWGFTAILGKLISLGSLHLVFYRMWIAVSIIFIYLIYKRYKFNLTRESLFKYLLGGLVIALHWITFYKAIKVSNVSITVVTLSTGTFFTALLEPLFFKRKINLREVVFGLMIVFSLYLITFYGDDTTTLPIYYLHGFLLALVSAFFSALFSVINGNLVKKYSPINNSFYQLLFGSLIVSIVILFTDGYSIQFFSISFSDCFYLFVLASVCTAWTFTTSLSILKYFTPYTVMLTINLEPVYSVLLALIIFDDTEAMSKGFYIGAFFILCLIVLNGFITSRQKNIN